MYYIQESDKLSKIARFFNIIKLENNHIILPITQTSIDEKKAYTLAIKTKNVLRKTNSKKLVISKIIKKQKHYMNYLSSESYEIVDGRWLFQILIFDVLEYLIKTLDIPKEDIRIGVLVNDISDLAIYAIKQFVIQYKHVKIVTNHINSFKNMEDQISEEYGIFMDIGNNKRKILTKTNIILNFDFPTELINRYTINAEASIVNFRGNVKIKNKRFNGFNINDYEIAWKDENYSDKFYAKDVYEAIQYKNQPIEELLKKIKRDNVKIKELIATNTVI